MSGDDHWRELFPRLFTPTYVDYADVDGVFTTQPFDERLISRLHFVATTEPGQVVVCESDLGWRFIPGGRREPGESISDLAARELLEEAGAQLVDDLRIFGGWMGTSRRTKPLEPHLPHPDQIWAFATARVRIVGPPTSPPDAEQITAVRVLPTAEAADFVGVHDEYDADVLRLAISLGLA